MGQVNLFAAFVVVRLVEIVGQALGADPLAGNAFFIDVEDVVFLRGGRRFRRRTRFAAPFTVTIATPAAATTTAPSPRPAVLVATRGSAIVRRCSFTRCRLNAIRHFAPVIDIAVEALGGRVVVGRRSRFANGARRL